jgi:hypothetical protein
MRKLTIERARDVFTTYVANERTRGINMIATDDVRVVRSRYTYVRAVALIDNVPHVMYAMYHTLSRPNVAFSGRHNCRDLPSRCCDQHVNIQSC